MQRSLRMYGEWGIKLKHKLQWKMIGIMFISMIAGVMVMGICETIIYDGIYHMTPEEAERAFAQYSIFFNIIFAIVAISVYFMLSRKIVKRIEVMNRNVEKIARGQMKELTSDEHKDELGCLAVNINTMADKISQSLQKEQDMVCNLAHDLRTPITSISGYVELIEKNCELSEEGKSYTEILARKADDLSKQVDELLEYSILKFKEKEYTMETLSLSSLLEQVLIDFIPILEREEITFKLEGNSKPYNYTCNQLLLIRLFENLITNSIRYGKEGKKIEVEIEGDHESIRIHFSNYGNLLSKEEEKHLFEAFYQGKTAKDYKTESKGLGLAIAKEIIEIHHGTITVKCDKQLNKVTFLVEFPLEIVNKL